MVSNKKCTVGGVDGSVRGDGVGRGDIMEMGRCGDGVMVWGWGDGVGRGDVMGGGIMFEGGANGVGFR